MNTDQFGRTLLTESTALELLYSGKLTSLAAVYFDEITANQFNNSIDANKDPYTKTNTFKDLSISIEDFDKENQSNWFMPNKYLDLDIENWLIDQCKTDLEKARVLEELELFVRFDMINLLRFLKYLVDFMRSNNIVWGLGRGSSVASYCLYLIGVHKVDSIKYNLDIKEFLK